MARKRIEWRRKSPRRAVGRVGWTAVAAALALGPAWLLFGAEPQVIDDGAVNPFALVVPLLAALFGLLILVQVLAIVRRPVVSADHYALSVRPGVVRTLVLPWGRSPSWPRWRWTRSRCCSSGACQQVSRSADWPRWLDQAHLRSAKRVAARVSAYDLAVPMGEFLGTPRDLLGELAWWAPDHVTVADRGRW